MHHNWTPYKPGALTRLAYYDAKTGDAVELWVQENENPDLDEDGMMECFRTDGTQIVIDRDCHVHAYERVVCKWIDREPKAPTAIQRNRKTGLYVQRQRTTYSLTRIGVGAQFQPVYDRKHVTNA